MAFEEPEVVEDEFFTMRQVLQALAGFFGGNLPKPGPHSLEEALQLSDWNENREVMKIKIITQIIEYDMYE